jgi:hypothetical protein
VEPILDADGVPIPNSVFSRGRYFITQRCGRGWWMLTGTPGLIDDRMQGVHFNCLGDAIDHCEAHAATLPLSWKGTD